MTRWGLLLLPALGLLAIDPVFVDFHAFKEVVLGGGALLGGLLCLADAARGARAQLAWSPVTLVLWGWVAVRGWMALRSEGSGEEERAWIVLFALALAHTLALSVAGPAWLAQRAPRLFGALLALNALFALAQAYVGRPQANAFFANANFAGAGIAMLLPYGLALRPPWRWALLAAGLAGLAATQSRGGALAAAAALALLFVPAAQRRLRIALLLGLPALVLAAGLQFGDRNTVKVRLAWYRAASRLGLEHPVAGLGAGAFLRAYPPVRPLEEHQISGGRIVHSVHNDLLESWVEGGGIGLAAHLLLVVAAVRAARRQRPAAASLLAFAVAGLVDLPMRDPSLLALALFGLTLIAEPRPTRAPAPLLALPLLALLPLGLPLLDHWRADHAYRAFQRDGEAAALDRALAREPAHPEALLARGRAEDLERLLAQRPHHADALYNRGGLLERVSRDAAIAQYQEILLKHDPHHVSAATRLAELVGEQDPIRAISLLASAVRADPRRFEPRLALARIHRRTGRLDAAVEACRAAAARGRDPRIAEEFLQIVLAQLRGGEEADLAGAAGAVTAARLAELAHEALARADAAEAEARERMPRAERLPGEADAPFARRVEALLAPWRRERDARTGPDLREAFALAEALLRKEPGPDAYHLAARAARGLGSLDRARRYDASGYFLEGLAALREGADATAALRFRRAFTADGSFAADEATVVALREFLRAHPSALDRAPKSRALLRDQPRLAPFVGG
ncbi:MAG: O-antigen ligase family protein [Planctomycetaceae bacterium]